MFVDMTYDASRAIAVLYGGFYNSSFLSDTWTWDGGVWRQVATTGGSGYGTPLAYDGRRGTILSLSGTNTFEWNGVSWGELINPGGPTNLSNAAVVYDSARDRIVTFSGTGLSGVDYTNTLQIRIIGALPPADLAASQSISANPIAVSSNVTFTIAITNRGPAAASALAVTGTLPGNVTFVSAIPSQGTFSRSGPIVSWSPGTLANGFAASLAITVRPLLSGVLTNTAQVSSATPDPNLVNNFSSAQINVLGSASAASWRFVTIPGLPVDFVLGKVWARTSTEAYVWGSRIIPGTGTVPEAFLFRWNGYDWFQVLDFPGQQPGSVFGVGSSEVFISLRDPVLNHSRVFRSIDNGQNFIEQTLPPEAVNNFLRNFAGTPNNVQVGTEGGNIIRFNGTSWTTVYSNPNEDVYALTMLSPTEGYFVTCWGWGQWDGSQWQFHGRQFDFCDLADTWAVRDGGGVNWYAVGNNNFANGVRIWKFDEPSQSFSGKFNYVAYDGDGYNIGGANGVWGSAADDIYVSGNLATQSGGARDGHIYHYDGVTWARLANLEPLPGISGIAGTARDDVWISLQDGRLLHLAPTTPGSAPSILTPAASIGVPQGEAAYFAITATGTSPLAYQWYFNGTTAIPGATSPFLVLGNLQPSDGGSYSVVVTNAFGRITNSANLTVLVAGQPQLLVVTVPTNVVLSAGVGGLGSFQFQWRKNGANIPGATNATYTVSLTSPSDGGSYSVVCLNGFGSIVRDIAVITAQLPAPVQDNFVNRLSIVLTSGVPFQRAGTNVGATVEQNEPIIAGKPGGASVWYKWIAPSDGVVEFNTFGSTFDTLLGVYTGTSLAGLSLVADNDDDGLFFTSRLRFSAIAGTEYQIVIAGHGPESGDFLLQGQFLASSDVVPRITIQPISRTVLSNTAISFLVVAEPPSVSYQWYFNGIPLPNETGGTLTVTSVGASNVGSYSALVRNQSGTQSVQSRVATLEIGPQGDVQSYDKLEDLIQAVGPSPGGLPRLAGGSPRKMGASLGFLSVSAGLPASQFMNNAGSSAGRRDPYPCGIIGSASRWVTLQAVGSGLINLDTRGSSNVVALGVYRYTDDYFATTNLLLACDPGNGAGSYSLVRFAATNGQKFLVQVDSAANQTGLIQLNSQLGCPPWGCDVPAPTPSLSAVPVHTYNLGTNIHLTAPGTTYTNLPLTYQWFQTTKNTTNQIGFGKDLFLSNVNPTNHGGLYTLVISNPFGRQELAMEQLTVRLPLEMRSAGISGGQFWYHPVGNWNQAITLQFTTKLNSGAAGWSDVEPFTNTATGIGPLRSVPVGAGMKVFRLRSPQ